MHLILGGRYMGKKIYAEKLYGKFDNVYDLSIQELENVKNSGLIINLHIGIKNLLMKNINAFDFFKARIKFLRQYVITGDEISGGIIPVDKFERQWRDETGKIYQFLANEAEIVDRVFAGLAIRLKG